MNNELPETRKREPPNTHQDHIPDDDTKRTQLLDCLYGLTSSSIDELVSRIPEASKYVTQRAAVMSRVSELVEFLESSTGPGLESVVPLLKCPQVHDFPSASTRLIFDVPYRENIFFRGRSAVLAKLRNSLSEKNAVGLGQCIRGLGGIGKTETAVTYAYKYRDQYRAIFWVRADKEEDLAKGFVAIFHQLWPRYGTITPEDARIAVLEWLSNESNWLLIFDNADMPSVLSKYVPQNVIGHILVTSRANVIPVLGLSRNDVVELSALSETDSLSFLLARSGRKDVGGEELAQAKNIVKLLAGLPLALEQAGSYLAGSTSTFSDYLTHYHNHSTALLERGDATARDYEDSVATTWSLNVETVQKESPASADLLRCSAFLNQDDIPFELITMGGAKLGAAIANALQGVKDDPFLLHRVLEPLDRSSLIRIKENNTFAVHRLLQQISMDVLPKEERRVWLQRVVRAAVAALPVDAVEDERTFFRLSSHIRRVLEFVDKHDFVFAEAMTLANDFGVCLQDLGFLEEASLYYMKSLKIASKAVSENDLELVAPINNLALVYHRIEYWAHAEQLYEQTLRILRRTLGEEHSQFAMQLSNLASLYESMGRFSKAEDLYKQAQGIFLGTLGEDEPNYTVLLNNLTKLYLSMGRYSEAELVCKESMAIIRRTHGGDHISLAWPLNNLASLFLFVGRYAEAESHFEHALEIVSNSPSGRNPVTKRIRENYEELLARRKFFQDRDHS